MTTAADLTVVALLAAVWLGAGLLAETLPAVRSPRRMRRRLAWLSALVRIGLLALAAVPLVAVMLPGTSAAPTAVLLPAVPALVVLAATLRRLTSLRRGAAAFTTAPQAPVPPALRAAAAHPLLAAPLQVTGVAALVGLPIAAGLVTVPGGALVGTALGIVGAAVLGIGARHAQRHSRLSPLAMAPVKRAPRGVAWR